MKKLFPFTSVWVKGLGLIGAAVTVGLGILTATYIAVYVVVPVVDLARSVKETRAEQVARIESILSTNGTSLALIPQTFETSRPLTFTNEESLAEYLMEIKYYEFAVSTNLIDWTLVYTTAADEQAATERLNQLFQIALARNPGEGNWYIKRIP